MKGMAKQIEGGRVSSLHIFFARGFKRRKKMDKFYAGLTKEYRF
jgi:hypothetical protein